MPRLYMHLMTGSEIIQDPEGAEFEDLAAARTEALVAAREIMSERIRTGRFVDGYAFEISDEFGRVQLTFPFSDAISR